MSKVFVLQEPVPRKSTGWVPDLSPAKKFGELVYVFRSGQSISDDLAAARSRIKEAFADFNVTQDYILWVSGDPIVPLLVSSYLSDRFDAVRILQWQRLDRSVGTGFYTEVFVELF